MQPYNVEVSKISEQAFERIAADWPLIVDALDALFTMLEESPHQLGIHLPHMEGGEFFVTQTPGTTGRPSMRVLYQIEEDEGRVTIHHFTLA